jgi:hypothetical protein
MTEQPTGDVCRLCKGHGVIPLVRNKEQLNRDAEGCRRRDDYFGWFLKKMTRQQITQGPCPICEGNGRK